MATRFPVRGNRISAPTIANTAAIPHAPASQRSSRESKYTATNATNSGKVAAADAGGMQPNPVLAKLHR